MTYMFHTFMQVLSTGFVHPDFSVHAAADGSDGQPDVSGSTTTVLNHLALSLPLVTVDWVHIYY